MLVLARKTNQSIHIGDDIVIKVTQLSRGMVRLGIEAPNHVRILRGELLAECNNNHLPAPVTSQQSQGVEVQSVA